jgi:cold shock CspA family protein
MRERGSIKKYYSAREDSVFIRREGQSDLFFLVSALEQGAVETLRKGMPVEFEVTSSRSGRPQAARVTLG